MHEAEEQATVLNLIAENLVHHFKEGSDVKVILREYRLGI